MLHPSIAKYIINHLDAFNYRDAVLEVFTIPDRILASHKEDGTYTVEVYTPMYVGKIVLTSLNELGYITHYTHVKKTINDEDNTILHTYSCEVTIFDKLDANKYQKEPLAYPSDVIYLPDGTLPNQPKGELKTIVGNLIMNYIVFVIPFGNILPYINHTWTVGKIEPLLSDALLNKKITPAQYKTYVRQLYYLGHITEVGVVSHGRHSLYVNPAIIKRKKELLTIHKDALARGDAVVMANIEAELIAMDKADLKGTTAMKYLGMQGKSFDIHRKKLFLSTGMTELFGEPGKFKFLANSLDEGWDKNDFDTIAGEIRSGSYFRGIDTAKGGEATKFILRILQSARIVEQNCGTTKTESILLTKEMAKVFKYRYILDNGKLVKLDADNVSRYIDKVVKLRSPMYCVTPKHGFCYTCMGGLFEDLEQRALAMRGVELTSTFLKGSLAKFHASTYTTVNISDIDRFIY